MAEIYGHGWCQNCDANTVLAQYERNLVYLQTEEQWDLPISVYCEDCGHKHTSTPKEYFKNVDSAARLVAAEDAIKLLNHMELNLWYPMLNMHLANVLIKTEALTSGVVNLGLINTYATIGYHCSEFLYDLKYDKNNWIETNNAYPKGSLVDIKVNKSEPNKIRGIDELKIIEFLYHGEIDLNDYPYMI